MKRDKIIVNDRQLACARIASTEGQDYLKGMAAAGNYAWVNRSSMTFLTRQVGAELSLMQMLSYRSPALFQTYGNQSSCVMSCNFHFSASLTLFSRKTYTEQQSRKSI